MCGIVGGWWLQPLSDVDKNMRSALGKLSKRGPDDQGFELYPISLGLVALGHTRLSIIDLTSAGHQPMTTRDGRYSIVYNGEIYNYKELREELTAIGVSFDSNSDTEVLLYAWSQWGRDCLARLQGMFAFVVYDHTKNLLTAVRDAFGIKPFFYDINDQRFVFASEQSALLSIRDEPVKANLQRSYDYLVHADYDSQEQSFIEGVKHLMPGCFLSVDLETGSCCSPEAWWQPSFKQNSNLSFDQAADAVRKMFLENIRLHLRSDVPIGVALSGGIDSSSVVCAVRYLEPNLPINTFSYIAQSKELSEEYWVDRVNSVTDSNAHKVSVTERDFIRDLDSMIQAQGEPFGSTSVYAQYRVFQLARENGIIVTLDGQGADELLAGYDGYPGQRLLSLLEKKRGGAALGFAKHWCQWPGRSYKQSWMYLGRILFPDWLYAWTRKVLGRNFKPSWLNIQLLQDAGVAFKENRYALVNEAKGRRVIELLAQSLQNGGIPSLLRHADRNSMWFSVESRVPFLTIPFAELLLSLPEEYLISPQGETKHVFRAAMRGIVPDDILDRKDKIGFSTPEKEWVLRQSPILRKWLAEAEVIPFVNQKELLNAFDDMAEGKVKFTWQIWRWVNYVRWYVHLIESNKTEMN